MHVGQPGRGMEPDIAWHIVTHTCTLEGVSIELDTHPSRHHGGFRDAIGFGFGLISLFHISLGPKMVRQDPCDLFCSFAIL